MKITAIRPAPAGAGARTLAHFDAAVSDDLRIYGLMLKQFADGTRRTIAPQANGRHSATFTPALGEQLTAAASLALKDGLHADVRH
jgi:hypothetical protein